MKKSMYSLILMDDVVARIDALAYERGTSRSALINQILADCVSMMTPQKRIEEIFHSLSAAVRAGSALQVQAESGSMLSLRSVLNYKYNPTIRYSVEITTEEGGYACLLKVVSRTQSDALLSRLSIFYELWSQIEQNALAGRLDGQLQYRVSGAQFQRRLQVDSGGAIQDSQRLGRAIGDYVRLFDRALKVYFEAEYGVDMKTFEGMQRMYDEYLEQAELII